MKANRAALSALVVGAGLIVGAVCVPEAGAQSFLDGFVLSGAAGDLNAAGAAESGQYGDGMRAIHEERWKDAESIFGEVAKQPGAHADGALFWKAYAENKKGEAKAALDTCMELRRRFPASAWLDECGALRIEILARTGKTAEPKDMKSDDLKLLALNTLLHKDEKRGVEEIEEVLTGDGSPHLKEGVLYLLRNSGLDPSEPQIVRIHAVEGDVRVARGLKKDSANEGAWETAEVNLPLEAGYTLVTGAGRAEIELEDASVVYLGENSALSLNELSSTAGVPYSEMVLLTGTAWVDYRAGVPGDSLVLQTPTENFVNRFPDRRLVRVDSYLDAMAEGARDRGAYGFLPQWQAHRIQRRR
jgi:hypothetical protein